MEGRFRFIELQGNVCQTHTTIYPLENPVLKLTEI
jgi:hypothetical protein